MPAWFGDLVALEDAAVRWSIARLRRRRKEREQAAASRRVAERVAALGGHPDCLQLKHLMWLESLAAKELLTAKRNEGLAERALLRLAQAARKSSEA